MATSAIPIPAGATLEPIQQANSVPIPDGATLQPQDQSAPPQTTIGPSTNASDIDLGPSGGTGTSLTMPLVKALISAHDKLRDVENLTQEGRNQHPIQAKLGDMANKIEGLLTGNEEHPEAAIGTGKTGILTNPVTGALIPGAEGAPAAASALEGIANLGKSAYGTVRTMLGGTQAATDATTATQAPSLVKQVMQGEKVAQAPAEAAIRQGVQSATESAGTADQSVATNIQNNPIARGNQTVLDQHLHELRANEIDAYDKMDEAAGFDVKQEKANLSNDNYKLKQLGNTPEDAATREKLTASIQDSQARIADAEQKMKAADIDPTEADSIHQTRMAGIDFRKSLIKNTNAADGSLNVKGLLNDAKNLQNSKFGDRLTQFFGDSATADQYVAQLKAAQATGEKALSTKEFASSILRNSGIAGGLIVGGKEAIHALSH